MSILVLLFICLLFVLCSKYKNRTFLKIYSYLKAFSIPYLIMNEASLHDRKIVVKPDLRPGFNIWRFVCILYFWAPGLLLRYACTRMFLLAFYCWPLLFSFCRRSAFDAELPFCVFFFFPFQFFELPLFSALFPLGNRAFEHSMGSHS